LYCDASTIAIGGAIHQQDPAGGVHSIAFHSRLLTATEKRYPICELEALAVVFLVERCTELLMGKPFVIYTDNSNLVHVFKSTNTGKTNRILRYAIRLSEFHFDIRLIPTAKNTVADYLSRFHCIKTLNDYNQDTVNVITRSQARQVIGQDIDMKVDEKNELVADVERVKDNEEQKQDNSKVLPEEIKSIEEIPKNLKYHQQQDPFLQKLEQELMETQTRSQNFKRPFIKENGIWYFLDSRNKEQVEKRIVVPKSLVSWALALFHDHKLAG